MQDLANGERTTVRALCEALVIILDAENTPMKAAGTLEPHDLLEAETLRWLQSFLVLGPKPELWGPNLFLNTFKHWVRASEPPPSEAGHRAPRAACSRAWSCCPAPPRVDGPFGLRRCLGGRPLSRITPAACVPFRHAVGGRNSSGQNQ